MPTKINRAGNQQNYVPKGNGDASGEYGDNATGSNVHFQTFKKPEETKQKTETKKPEEEKIKSNSETTIKAVKQNMTDSFKRSDYYKKSNDEHIEKVINKVIENNDTEKMVVLNKMLEENNKLTIRFGGSGRYAGCAWGSGSVSLDSDSPHVYNHEIGHVWDAFYGKGLVTNEGKYPMSERLVTRWIDNSEGKCFNDVIHEELGINGYDTVLKGWNIRYVKRGVDKREDKIKSAERIGSIYNDLCDKILDEKTGIKNAFQVREELRVKRKNALDEARDFADKNQDVAKAYDEYQDSNHKENVAENNYRNSMMEKGAYSIIYSNSPEVLKAREEKNNSWNKYLDLLEKKRDEYYKTKGLTQEETDKLNKIEKSFYSISQKVNGLSSIIGDTSDYMGVGRSKYATGGHGKSYFDKRKDDGYSAEVWANMFDCYLAKDKRQYETLKQMLPRSTKIFEEAISKFGKVEK